AFSLTTERPTLLVMGGSQGAQGINRAIVAALPYLTKAAFQAIHLTGKADEQRVREAYGAAGIKAFVAAVHHRMEQAYSAANLCVARAGAASLSELSHFALPAILIPYPYAAEDHQTSNAKIFARAGAATLIAERELSGDALAKELLTFFEEPARLADMSGRCAALAH